MQFLKFVVVLFGFVLVKSADNINVNINNVCGKIKDYDDKINNENCWYNSDVDLLVPEIIKKYGYPFETHEVITQDGYILKLFRIPYGKKLDKRKRQPVFLQHGIFSSSAPWVVNGNDSIGFILADEGYDVWLGNSRGSFYGKGHVKLSVNDTRYWNFSYHEMGVFDFPKSLDLIYKITGRNDIIVIGQSMATNIQLVYASELPEHARKRVKFMIYLAPTIFLRSMRTPLAKLASFWPVIQNFGRKNHLTGILNKEDFPIALSNIACLGSSASLMVCLGGLFAIFGFDYENFSPHVIPVVFGHYPAGSSLNTAIHLGQGVLTDDFAHYDHGYFLNLKYYGSPFPPSYNLSRVAVPGYIIYGKNDWVAPEKGAEKLYKKLPSAIGIYEIQDKKYNHIDFFFAKNVKTELIDHIIRVVDKYRS